MLAGGPPFTGPTAQAILARHAVDRVPPLRTVRTTIPEAIEQAVERALAKVPSDRFDSAAEFAAALTAIAPPEADIPSSVAPDSAQHRAGRAGCGRRAGGRRVPINEGEGAPGPPRRRRHRRAPLRRRQLGDTALARLGKDLAVTVSASLDGVGGVKATDRLSIASATAGKQNLSITEGAVLARELGASSILRGTLVGTGEIVRLDLGLYDTKSLAPLASGIAITGHRDSLAALTDSVTWLLLHQIWQRGDVPSPSLSAVTTKSLPALRAFLEGEHDLVAGDWDGSALAYRSAMAADSTLWLAYYGYALSQSWNDQPVEPAVIDVLKQQREGLPERERLLVDAFLVTDRTPRLKIEAYRLVTQRFPQYWPGWFLYADKLYHHRARSSAMSGPKPSMPFGGSSR